MPVRMAHAKTMVIDGALTLQGSYNWTRGAASNSEDLNLISSPAVAAAYTGHWRQRLALSARFDRREDWYERQKLLCFDGKILAQRLHDRCVPGDFWTVRELLATTSDFLWQ